MAVKLPDTLVPMADFPSAFAKDVQFTDGENLQDKLDNGKLGSSSSGTGLTEEQANNIEKIPSIEGIVTSNSQAIANKADKDHEHTEYLTEIPDEYVTDTELSSKGYATETFVTNKIAEASLSGGNVDLSGYATKDDIPTKTSELTNDSGFITTIPNIYALKTDTNKMNCVSIDNVSLKEYILTNCTETEKMYYFIAKTTCTDLPKASNFYITVERPGMYTYKVTAKELNDSNGIYVCTYRTISSSWTAWEKVALSSGLEGIPGGNVDLSGYALKTDIPTKVSKLENDLHYATSSEVSEIVGNINVNNLSSPLKGLVWNALGDSITAGNGTTKQYHRFISERTGCVVNNYGIASSTLSTQFKDKWTSNPMCERIDSMNANADIITLLGGINDTASDCVVGDINSFDTNTVYGALNVIIDKLLYRFPYSIIATIIPVKSSKPTVNQNIYEQICNAILEVSNKYSIPCLDLRNLCGINPFDDFMCEIYMPDLIHPNINGHRKMSYVIQNFLESIVFKYPNVEAIDMSLPSSYSIGRNNTEKLSLTWSPEDTSQKSVTWKSSAPDVVAVDYKGNITGLKNGTSTITCTNNNNNSLTTTCLVTVGDESVTGVTLDKQSHSLSAGELLDIHATIIPDDASNKNVTWSVNNEYCKIAPNGLSCTITAVSEGVSTITVTTEDGHHSATCSISVTGERIINDDLVDYASLKENFYLNTADGIEKSGNGYLTTDFINIEPDTEYIVGGYGKNKTKYVSICFYDENGEFINGSVNTDDYYMEITSPSNASKMKFSIYIAIDYKYSIYAYKKSFTPTTPLNINLYDGELLQAGAYYNGISGITENSTFDLTSYIPVEPTITVEKSVGYGANGFDENKNWCCEIDLSKPIPYGIYYILINLPSGKANQLTVVRKK